MRKVYDAIAVVRSADESYFNRPPSGDPLGSDMVKRAIDMVMASMFGSSRRERKVYYADVRTIDDAGNTVVFIVRFKDIPDIEKDRVRARVIVEIEDVEDDNVNSDRGYGEEIEEFAKDDSETLIEKRLQVASEV